MRMRKLLAWVPATAAFTGLAILSIALADPPAEQVAKKPSSYAPAKDLEAQVADLMERMEKDLAEEAEYESAQVKRVVKDANTMAVLAVVLGKHDQANGMQGPAKLVMQSALAVAGKAESYAEAKAALEKLKQAIKTDDPADISWQSVGDIEALMRQVPILNTRLRGSVRRLSRSQDKAARLSATLAAIAQISMFDDTYCVDDDDQAAWVKYCVQMREAASQCNAAVHRGDEEAAKGALKPLTRSCDDCHEQFREDE